MEVTHRKSKTQDPSHGYSSGAELGRGEVGQELLLFIIRPFVLSHTGRRTGKEAGGSTGRPAEAQLPARHATECQPHRRREPGRTPPELPGGAHTWILDFWPQNCERIRFCCLKPPSLRHVVMAATGNEHRALWAGNSQSTRADQTHFPPGPVSSHGFLPRTLPEARGVHWTMARPLSQHSEACCSIQQVVRLHRMAHLFIKAYLRRKINREQY